MRIRTAKYLKMDEFSGRQGLSLRIISWPKFLTGRCRIALWPNHRHSETGPIFPLAFEVAPQNCHPSATVPGSLILRRSAPDGVAGVGVNFRMVHAAGYHPRGGGSFVRTGRGQGVSRDASTAWAGSSAALLVGPPVSLPPQYYPRSSYKWRQCIGLCQLRVWRHVHSNVRPRRRSHP